MDSSRVLLALIVVGGVLIGAGAAVTYDSSNDVETKELVPLVAPDGMQVNTYSTTYFNQTLTDFTPTSGTVEVATEEGNITFYSSGNANVTIRPEDITGTWTNVTSITADPNSVTIDPEDKDSVVVGNEIDNISFRQSYGLDDGTIDFVYGGSTGQSRVTIQGVPADTKIYAVDADSNNILDAATSDSNGQVTFDALDNSEHAVTLTTDENDAPTVSDPSPTGKLQSEPSEISIQVNDTNFNQGDSVTVNITLDGSQIDSQTITSNQTVTTSMPQDGQSGGQHDWSVNATDDFGGSVTDSYTYSVPDTLYIRNETNHSELVTSPVDSTVTFFGEDQVYERSTSDGTVNMTGLPVNQNFLVSVQPSQNYTDRTVFLQSIYQQQSVYLLNSSKYDTVESRFELEDPTGQYDAETVLFIQKPINVSGQTSWQTVHSDEFGVEGVTTNLHQGQRYRIRIRGADGSTQIIGPYRADVGETVTVRPGTPSIDIGEYTNGYGANAVLTNRTLEYRYDDPTNETTELTIWIHEKGNQSNQLQANETYFDLGEMSAQSTLSENESKKTWVVNFIVDRNGNEFTKKIEVSNTKDIFPALPEPWGTMAGVMMLLLLAAAFSTLNATVGAVAVAVSGGVLFYAGFLGGVTSAAGIVLGLFVAAVNHVRAGQGP